MHHFTTSVNHYALNGFCATCQLYPNKTETNQNRKVFLQIKKKFNSYNAHTIFFQYILLLGKFPPDCLLNLPRTLACICMAPLRRLYS